RFADKVAATGAVHIPLPPEADFDDRDGFASFPERAKLKGVKAIRFDIEHVFARPAKVQYQVVMAAHAARGADVVLADPAFVGGALMLHLPRPTRPPVVMCSILPLPIESADTAP